MPARHDIRDSLGILTIGMLGLGLALYVVGEARVNISNTTWLTGDLWQVYSAWVQYNLDLISDLLQTDRLSYPIAMPIALFDPMPILLLVLSPTAKLLGIHGQFFGVYFLFCLIFQGIIGYLVTEQVIPEDKGRSRSSLTTLIKLIGGVFFITAPTAFLRFTGHTALASQWLLLLGIWTVLRFRRATTLNWSAANAGVVLLASGFNPYLTLMVVLNALAFAVVDAISRCVPVAEAALRCASVLLAAGCGLLLFGFASAASGGLHGGYGIYSMNLLSPFDSNGAATLLPLDIGDATGAQSFEGYQYLGLGVLLLGAVALILALAGRARRFDLFPALLVVLVAFCLALSTTVTVGSRTLFVLDVPVVSDLLSRFRASGRLFWIGGFWIIAIGIAIILRGLPRRLAVLLLGVLLVVQLVDIAGVATRTRVTMASLSRLELGEPTSALFAKADEAVIVVPPWQCDIQGTPGGVSSYEFLGAAALDNKLPINSFYAARTLPEQSAYHCDIKNTLQPLKHPLKERIYVVSDRYYAFYRGVFTRTHECQRTEEFGGFYLCVARSVGAPPEESPERTRSYGFAQGGSGLVGLSKGWSGPDADWTWAVGRKSRLFLPLGRIPPDATATVVMNLRVFLGSPDAKQKLRILAGGESVFKDTFTMEDVDAVGAGQIRFALDPGLVGETGFVLFDFEHPNAVSPKKLGQSADHRKLSIGLESIEVEVSPAISTRIP